jgi:hypothetical protein
MLVKDVDTWNRIIHQGEGYIYNDFGTQFPGNAPTWNTREFNKLHRASCRQVKRMTHITEGKLTKRKRGPRQAFVEFAKSISLITEKVHRKI